MNISRFVFLSALACILGGGRAGATAAPACGDPNLCNSGDASLGSSAIIGNSGIGQLDVGSGNFTIGPLIVGLQAGSIGTVNLNVGTLNDDAVIGDAGTGTFSNTSGTHNVTGNLILGNQSTGIGTYSITGATAVTNVSF